MTRAADRQTGRGEKRKTRDGERQLPQPLESAPAYLVQAGCGVCGGGTAVRGLWPEGGVLPLTVDGERHRRLASSCS